MTTSRWRGSTAVMLAALSLAVGVATAPAATEPGLLQAASSDAAAMAAIVQGMRSHGSDVRVERQPTTVGGQVIQVWVRARPGAFARVGVYTLMLLTDRHGRVVGERMSENKAPRQSYHFGDDGLEETYVFAFNQASNHQWNVEATYVAHGRYHSFDWTTGHFPGRGAEPRLTVAGLAVLWKQAAAVLTKMNDGVPVSDEEVLHPGLSCNPSTELTEGCKPEGAALARSGKTPARAASRAVATEAARDATYLEGRIRAAAGKRGSMTVVHVLHGCCGVVALEVYERSRPGRTARFGVYGLTLVTGPQGITQIKVFEDKTHGQYHLGGSVSALYAFELSPGGNAHLNEGNFAVDVSHAGHADGHWTTGKVELHEETAELTAAELQVLYGQALSVLNKAESHAPVSQEAYLAPGLPCGLPEHQACEVGGRW